MCYRGGMIVSAMREARGCGVRDSIGTREFFGCLFFMGGAHLATGTKYAAN